MAPILKRSAQYHLNKWSTTAITGMWTAGAIRGKQSEVFSVDAIVSTELLADKAKDLSIKKLREELSEGYGIFSGKTVQWAKLRVTNLAIRWVVKRVWHANQKSSFDTDVSLILEIPYTDDRELMQDILAWLPEVEVLVPRSLRTKLSEILKTSLVKNSI